MKLSQVDRLFEFLPEDLRLTNEAKSGDVRAFIKLYDAYVERVYRYIYCQVVDDRAAEGITFQTFFSAWRQLNRYVGVGLPFNSWLYSIAQDQVNLYYRTHKRETTPENDFLNSVIRNPGREIQAIRESLRFFTEGERQVLILKYVVCMPIKNIVRLMSMREGDIRDLQLRALQMLAVRLEEKEIKVSSKKFQRILADCQTRILNKTSTLEEQLALYPQYKADLAPLLRVALSLTSIRKVNPLLTFTAYTHEALLHHISTHPQPQPKRIAPTRTRQMSFAFTLLLLALLFTGTVHAQTAMPGESFYPWKRASENIWRAISTDPVSTDITLADRRLNEWLSVVNDPQKKEAAKNDYLEAVDRLKFSSEAEKRELVIPALQSQQQTLTNAGLSAPALNNYLNVVSTFVPTQVVPVMATPTQFVPTATAVIIFSTPTEIPPTATVYPTEIPPTATLIPTEIPPTATLVPTEIPPTETEVPTEIPPTETEVPTEIPPTPTSIFPPLQDLLP